MTALQKALIKLLDDATSAGACARLAKTILVRAIQGLLTFQDRADVTERDGREIVSYFESGSSGDQILVTDLVAFFTPKDPTDIISWEQIKGTFWEYRTLTASHPGMAFRNVSTTSRFAVSDSDVWDVRIKQADFYLFTKLEAFAKAISQKVESGEPLDIDKLDHPFRLKKKAPAGLKITKGVSPKLVSPLSSKSKK